MDTLQDAKLTSNVAKFVTIASEGLRISQSSAKSEQTNLIEVFIVSLKEGTHAVEFTPRDNITIIPERDVIFQNVSNKCQILSSSLERKLKESKSDDNILVNGHGTGISDQEQLTSIRVTLNEKLVPSLLSEIYGMLRDLVLRNTRLSLNRGRELGELREEIGSFFMKFKSKKVDDTGASSILAKVVTIVQEAVDISAEHAILGDLYFLTINHRQELIAKEHENTLGWIYDHDSSQVSEQTKPGFSQWLANNESIYWISGKPGSGKSTLVKYVAENPKTVEALKQWTGNNRLFTVSFYFWSSAKDSLQKSDLGLLRSILYQMLGQCPELIPHTFPEQWNQRHTGNGAVRRFVPGSTTEDFLDAFRRLSKVLPIIQVKFCLFIDGLDEFDGRMEDVIRLVDILSKTDNIKACLSSRQWKEFETSFGGENPWKLYIHERTRADMELYVSGLVDGNERFLKIKDTAGSESEVGSFIKEVVDAAEGVFLWVFLVVNALLEEVSPTDGISDIRKRLASTPRDLEKYFEKLLLDIDSDSREQSARLFLITLQAVQTLPLMSYWFAEHTSLNDVLEASHESISEDTAAVRLQDMSELLRTRCKGLLKIYNNQDGDEPPKLEDHNWLFNFRVDFLHRTVADFLSTTEISQFLYNWVKSDFNTHLEICKSSLATVKAIPSDQIRIKDPGQLLSTLNSFFSHVKFLERASSLAQTEIALLDSMISSLREHDGEEGVIKCAILGPGNYWSYHHSFNFVIMYHCVSYSLAQYVIQHLNQPEPFSSESPSGLLSACLSRDIRVRTNKFVLDPETIQLLLDQKLDPNLQWGDRKFSFWQQLVTTTYGNFLKGMMVEAEYDAIRRTMDHGPNMEIEIEIVGQRGLSGVKAGNIVEKMLSGEHFLS